MMRAWGPSNNYRIIKITHDFSKVEFRILLPLERSLFFYVKKKKLYIKKGKLCSRIFRYFTCNEKEEKLGFLQFSRVINISSVTCYS